MGKAIPKKCENAKDIIDILGFIKRDFEVVVKQCNNSEPNWYTKKEIEETNLYVKALDMTLDLMKKHTLKMPFETCKCYVCKADVPSQEEVGDDEFYCQNCGQKLVWKIKNRDNTLIGTKAYALAKGKK